MPNALRETLCRVTPTRDGPLLIEGPVEVTLDNGSTVRSDRFTVALCACRRSRTYPWCDTSHRRRGGGAGAPRAGSGHDRDSNDASDAAEGADE
ncbi:Iron-binding zinc finger CDGSH type [Streptomyces sp. S4.7]|uniref:CDGSH iron-sulfur domain-containing protein n=1 Tax=Streptomyces sp. S4.7 TaxID=2705439 RepID=UPI0013989D49|nr:CDGSH iron-sulfur domain-containing protein [Streptomyces sp. S4.7]QHY99488.1 Iron-binding zinc finger CDGSH type [Streptomyces sp. S4.7]